MQPVVNLPALGSLIFAYASICVGVFCLYMEDTETKPRTKVLKNGAVYDYDKGRIVANPGGGTTAITPARSRELQEIRAAKTARKLRDAIVKETMEALEVPKHAASDAVAAAGAILWREIVLNPEAYPRDRVLAYEKLSERAEMTSNHKRDGSENQAPPVTVPMITELLRELRAAVQPMGQAPEIVDGTVTDTRNE